MSYYSLLKLLVAGESWEGVDPQTFLSEELAETMDDHWKLGEDRC